MYIYKTHKNKFTDIQRALLSSLFLIIVLFFVLLLGCNHSQSNNGGLQGSIEIDGSSTVYPISVGIAEEFTSVHGDVRVNVGISGTGGGFKRFATGETEISNASRPIKDSEADVAKENGIEFIELMVAFDGLSVVVSKDNDFVQCLTVEELKKIWEPGSSVNTWEQVRRGFPAEDIELYGPDADSGTFDYFTEEILETDGAIRQDYTPSADDNVLVQGVQGSKYGLGYFGYAYYIENRDKLNVVAVDNGSGCVAPNEATINNGTYDPLSRPLFIYVNNAELAKPHVREFVLFYLDNASEIASLVGYVALPESDYQKGIESITQLTN